jgi:hypothetical protein
MESSNSGNGEIPMLYGRHVKSEANRAGNISVHDFDPPLLDGIEDEESGYLGRKFCKNVLLPHFERQGVSHIAASPSKRVLSTMIQSMPWETLRSAKITIMPLLVEQTDWRSDRTSSFQAIKTLISDELRQKGGEMRFEDIHVDFTLLFASADSWDTEPVYERFEMVNGRENLAQIREENEISGKKEVLNKPWHNKQGLWSPDKLHDRGKECCTELAKWAMIVLKHCSQPVFLILGHGGFASYMTEEVGNTTRTKLSDWATGEIRKYSLPWRRVDGDVIGDLLREDEQSRRKRLGVGPDDPYPKYDLREERDKAEAQRLWVLDIARENREHPEFRAFYHRVSE